MTASAKEVIAAAILEGAAAWDGIAKEKQRLGIARLGPGPGTTDAYRAMIAAQESES